jgi:pimeloyl-ACP methyl ester carboxylesterase
MTRIGIALAMGLLTACGQAAAQESVECPEAASDGVVCYRGIDANGARYLIAIPPRWNKVLIVHAHDGPDVKPPNDERVSDDFSRWSTLVKAGYAWAGTAYRREGFDVKRAAEDLESVRALFIAKLGAPRRIVVHGQGWGALVAARAIELHPRSYGGAFLTSGELAGGSRGEDPRIDLRVVYQYYCHNHPRPDEPQYPLWMGLAPGTRMTSADIRVRLNECTGSNLPTPKRTPQQRRALASIVAATRIPERTLPEQLTWATLVFADLVNRKLGGRNPFSTLDVRYAGTSDDRALNEGVARYRPDPAALAELAEDSDPTGRIEVPVLTLHGIGDPMAFVEHEGAYRETLERAGKSALLLQVFTTESEHRFLSTPEYRAALEALLAWIDGGRRPTPAAVAARCREHLLAYDGESCRIDPAYRAPGWTSRVYPRAR